MRRLALTAALFGSAALALLALAAGLFGRLADPPVTALADSPRCALPCWNGIRPGEMLVPRASQILVSQGYDPSSDAQDRAHMHYAPRPHVEGCAVRLEHYNAIVTETRLSNCPGLRLGDVLAALGPPEGVQPGLLQFSFRGGQVRVKLRQDGCAPRLSPRLPVSSISLSADAQPSGYIPWRGFMSPHHYLRLYPAVVLLSC
ncbi:MAG: hypothetical protein ACUVSX_00280 [Aggregatilineales bacterium]